jgi:nucleoside-diphosphate-sugar epimerase
VNAPGTIAITGTTGFLGGRLSAHLQRQGRNVVALNRRPSDSPAESFRPFSLGSDVETSALLGVDALIHAAWNLSSDDETTASAQNVAGSLKLLAAAKDAHIENVIFVSSMSAYEGTRQVYGRMKLAVEHAAIDSGYCVARPGLVYGVGAGGMSATLARVARLPIWPSFSRATLFTVADVDLVRALTAILDNPPDFARQVVGVAHPRPVPLAEVLTALAPHHRRRPSLRVPVRPLVWLFDGLSLARVRLPFRPDALLGLTESPPPPINVGLLAARDVAPRDFAAVGNSGENFQ